MRSMPQSANLGPRTKYIGGRLLQALFVLWAAFTVSFVILYWIPGDSLLARLSGGGEMVEISEEDLQALRAQYGLDDPIGVQYVQMLGEYLRLDFGSSIRNGEAVTTTILEALPYTLALTTAAVGLAVIAAMTVALVATYTRSGLLRAVLTSIPSLGIAVPTFWIGLMLLIGFSFQLRWFPSSGNEGLSSLVMPAVTLAVPLTAVLSQVLTKSMTEELAQPYVTTARGKGVGRGRVHLRHAFRNALFPVVTMLGLLAGNAIAGSVAVETVFSRSGLGRVTFDAVSLQDIPLIQGLVVVGALVFVSVNLIVDFLYPLLDPRVSLTAPSGSSR